MSDDMAKGCNNCPARSKCEGLTYRGSACAALRYMYGAPEDPDIRSGADDLISRKALAKAAKNISSSLLNEWDALGVLELIYRQPAIDAVLVKHGRNETQMNPVDEFICSECGFTVQDFEGYDNEEEVYYEFNPHYCPNCGVKIDGSENGVVDEVPPEFVARTLEGKEITGETRDKLYRVMDKSIDKFLESEVGGEK